MTNPAIPILEARSTCKELMALLLEENSGLSRHDVSQMEARLQHKKRLTMRLEQLLRDLKQNGSLWKADASSRAQAMHLAEEVAHFQELARANAAMLRAAHQLRADLILTIRDVVETETPRAQTYGANGALQQSGGTARLMAREA